MKIILYFLLIKKNKNQNPKLFKMTRYADMEWEDDAVSVDCELEEAMETVLNFGKYKGIALKHIVKSRQGRSYLHWLSETDGDKWAHTRHKCKVVLAFAKEELKARVKIGLAAEAAMKAGVDIGEQK